MAFNQFDQRYQQGARRDAGYRSGGYSGRGEGLYQPFEQDRDHSRDNRRFRQGEGYPTDVDYSFGDYGNQHPNQGYPSREYSGSTYSGRDYSSRDYSPRDYGEDYGPVPDSSRRRDARFGGSQRSDFDARRNSLNDYGHNEVPWEGAGYLGSSEWDRMGSSRYGAMHGSTPGWTNDPSYQDRYGAEEGWARGGRNYAGGFDRSDEGEHDIGRSRQDFRGRAPKGYERSDERIREDVCEHLTRDSLTDASEVSVTVKSGVVTLEGSIGSRFQKHRIENIADDISGVKDVRNQLNVTRQERSLQRATSSSAQDGSGAQRATATQSSTTPSRASERGQ